jgi:hypothetical protein
MLSIRELPAGETGQHSINDQDAQKFNAQADEPSVRVWNPRP